jgi:alpha-beta hydrolase superfamily lysophospholipase
MAIPVIRAQMRSAIGGAMKILAALLLFYYSIAVVALEPASHFVDSDGHPMAVWEKSPTKPKATILLLHGRTWSALPDFDLQVEDEDLSFMDGLTALGYRVFALDARGYGGTPRDASGWLTPQRAAADVVNVLRWIKQRSNSGIHLFGWSYGSMVSQLVVQRESGIVTSAILFGYPYNPERYVITGDEVYPEQPPALPNTALNAASDFVTPGSISRKAVETYVERAMDADPVRVDFKDLHHWLELDAGKVQTPTLLLKGEFDPLAPMAAQAKFFSELGTSKKWFVVLAGGDHAALLESPRDDMLHAIDSFIQSQ